MCEARIGAGPRPAQHRLHTLRGVLWAMSDALKTGQTYSRRAIANILGGSMVAFAPSRDGQVTCLCINPVQQRCAPDIVVTPNGREIDRMRDRIIEQVGPFPLFLKEATCQWRYLGRYCLGSYQTQPDTIERYAHCCQSGGRRLTAVLYFKPVDHA